MSRIRTIKPDFWTDGKVVSISPYARLMFIGMWNFALCDKGHVADDALKLKLQVLPIDNVDASALITELIDSGLVVRISLTAEARTFLHVKRMADHQKCDTRWNSRCPVCAHSTSQELTETHASLDETHRDSPKLPEPLPSKGKERKGKEEDMRIDKPSIRVIDSEFESWWQHYPLKKAKGQAEKAFRAARKLVDLDTLIAATHAYRASVDPKFIAYGSTWLNGKRWLDDDIQPVSESALDEWLRDCWTNCNTKAVSDRCGLGYFPPDIPDGVTDLKAWHREMQREWITANRDVIIARILERESA